MNMIEFKCISDTKYKHIPNKYPELLLEENDFRIIINGKLFFHDTYFPVLEFLFYAKKWTKMNSASFEYNSVETEENPLISFICKNEKYNIHSPWQLFESHELFTKQQLVFALQNLEKSIIDSNLATQNH